jgi:hypothetical protein
MIKTNLTLSEIRTSLKESVNRFFLKAFLVFIFSSVSRKIRDHTSLGGLGCPHGKNQIPGSPS